MGGHLRRETFYRHSPGPPPSFFFRDFFALGHEQTNGRFSAFEIDFMDDNFRGSPSMFETVDSAATWYAGLADWRIDPAQRLDRDRIGLGTPP